MLQRKKERYLSDCCFAFISLFRKRLHKFSNGNILMLQMLRLLSINYHFSVVLPRFSFAQCIAFHYIAVVTIVLWDMNWIKQIFSFFFVTQFRTIRNERERKTNTIQNQYLSSLISHSFSVLLAFKKLLPLPPPTKGVFL